LAAAQHLFLGAETWSVSILHNVSRDDAWPAGGIAGDTSSGYDWYTKRAMLAGVYSAMELYMLTGAATVFLAELGTIPQEASCWRSSASSTGRSAVAGMHVTVC